MPSHWTWCVPCCRTYCPLLQGVVSLLRDPSLYTSPMSLDRGPCSLKWDTKLGFCACLPPLGTGSLFSQQGAPCAGPTISSSLAPSRGFLIEVNKLTYIPAAWWRICTSSKSSNQMSRALLVQASQLLSLNMEQWRHVLRWNIHRDLQWLQLETKICQAQLCLE